MADKIVQVIGPKITATSEVYTPKLIDLPVPIKIITSVTNMGEESIPNPYLFKRLSSDYLVNDTVKVTYKLSKLDLASVSEEFTRVVDYRRRFEELLAPLDNYKVFFVTKTLADSASSQDIFQVGFQKPQQDSVSILDPKSIHLLKQLQSAYTTTEQVNLNYQKVSLETVVTGDVFSRVVNFNRNFESLADATDDFYGLANVDDDQIARFGKTLTSFTETATQYTVVFGKGLNTGFIAQEQLTVGLIKPLSSQSTTNTKNKFTLTKPLVDIAEFATQQVFELGKLLDSQSVVNTLLTFLANKAVNTQTTTSEVRTAQALKQLVDPVQAQSENKFTLTKPKTDLVSFASTHTVGANKALISYSNTDELVTFVADKQLLDNTNTDNIVSIISDKHLVTDFLAQDHFSRVWQANKDFSSLTDSSSLTTFDVSSVLLNSAETASLVDIQTTKALVSETELSDTFSRVVSYNRNLLDIVNSTDDFYGIANIDDDQTARFGKNVITILDTGDIKLFSATKVLSSQMLAEEQIILQAQKSLSSQALFKHQTSFSTGKNLLDLVDIPELVAKQATKPLVTNFAIGDSVSLQVIFSRTLQEHSDIDDTSLKSLDKVVLDFAILDDSFSRVVSFNRVLSSTTTGTDLKSVQVTSQKQDSANATDVATKSGTKSLLDTADTLQLVQAAVEKGLISQASTGEFLSFFKYGNRFFNEIALVSNPGVINNQGYFLESYVEPGYAGTNTYIS